MPLTFKDLRLKLHLTAGVITALLALCGGVGAFAAFTDSPFALASHRYVDERVDSALQVATARIGNLQRESSETRLQLNQVRREGLWADKFNREQQLKIATDSATKQLLRRRLDEIEDALRDVNAERDRLRAFSIP